MRWNSLDDDVLRARVYLNRRFLKRNLIYITLACIALLPYQSIKLFVYAGFIAENDIILNISEIMEFLSIVFLVGLLYEWFCIFHKLNK